MLSLALLALIVIQLMIPMEMELPQTALTVPRRMRLIEKPLKLDFPEILQRPIFTQDRLPMIEPMDGLTLIGVGLVGTNATALLQMGSGPALRVHDGMMVAGWRIVSVESDRVFFEKQGGRRMLKMDIKGRRALQSIALSSRGR